MTFLQVIFIATAGLLMTIVQTKLPPGVATNAAFFIGAGLATALIWSSKRYGTA
jgi:hypothetical protein